MEQSKAEKFYNILNTALDNQKLHSEKDTILLLKEHGAMECAVMLGDLEEFTLKFDDQSTLQLIFGGDSEYFDIDVRHGWLIPKRVH